jgi:hypothetical protein
MTTTATGGPLAPALPSGRNPPMTTLAIIALTVLALAEVLSHNMQIE